MRSYNVVFIQQSQGNELKDNLRSAGKYEEPMHVLNTEAWQDVYF